MNKPTFKSNGSYLIKTFGCQMNNHDSEKIAGVLQKIGYRVEVDDFAKADIVVFNTCCVRENADDRFYGNLGLLKPLKAKRPDMMIAVSGCIAQRDGDKIFKRAPYVDFVFGANNISDLPDLIESRSIQHNKSFKTDETADISIYEIPSIRKDKLRAWVPISIGCDNFCSYCIVPYVRGRERSFAPDIIYDAVEKLASEGAVEITLLGQNVNSYGNDLGFREGAGFSELLQRLNKIDGIKRVRFTTSHPKDLCDDTIRSVADLDKLCKHIHLPVQSGSNNILSKMNRKYTRDSYISKIDKIRELMPQCSISTDIIVGFPGETEKDFKETLDIVDYCSFDSAYTFIYSPREKTVALKLADDVSAAKKNERFNRLVEVVNANGLKQNVKAIGKEFEVLVESVSRKNEKMLKARTGSNKIVHFKGEKELIGQFCRVMITDAKTWHLFGELLDK